MNERTWRQVFSRIGWGASAFLFLGILAQLILLQIAYILGLAYSANTQLVINALSLYAVGFPAAALILKSAPSPNPDRETEDWTAGIAAGAMAVCVGVMWAGNALGRGFMAVFGPAGSYNPVETVILQSNLFLEILLVVLIGPAVEELLTRKLLIDRILLFGERTAVVVSAVVFGLIHGNFYQFFYALGIGLVLGYVYVRTGKIRYTILIHMGLNFLGSAVPLLFLEMFSQGGNAGILGSFWFLGYSLLDFGAAVCGIVLLCWYWRKKRFYRTPYEWTAPRMRLRDRMGICLLNPGMIVFLLLSAALFWMNL